MYHEITLTVNQKLRTLIHNTEASPAYLVFCSMRQFKEFYHQLAATAVTPLPRS